MKITEAIETVKAMREEMWIRPAHYNNPGIAYVVSGSSILEVPSQHGGDRAEMFSVDLILDDWEIVDPDTVLDKA